MNSKTAFGLLSRVSTQLKSTQGVITQKAQTRSIGQFRKCIFTQNRDIKTENSPRRWTNENQWRFGKVAVAVSLSAIAAAAAYAVRRKSRLDESPVAPAVSLRIAPAVVPTRSKESYSTIHSGMDDEFTSSCLYSSLDSILDSILDSVLEKLSVIPTIRAAINPDNNNDATLSTSKGAPTLAPSKALPTSRRFNFIADTVEQTSGAVVNIDVGGLFKSNGSGFIVSEDGLIVTNAHVVRNKLQNVTVKLPDGRTFPGVVTALDNTTDLAVVRLKGVSEKLPVMSLGKSDSVRTGEWVIAMGSPLTLKNTITVGVVSTVHRSSQDIGLNKNIDYIQTDAAITFGNSGGPLVNLDGDAIGVNTIKMAEGISFAIPIDAVKDFLRWAESQSPTVEKSNNNFFSRFKSNQSAESQKRNYIGITMLTLTPAIIMELQSRHPGFPSIRGGIFVHRVMEGSPSEKAGLIPGDIVLGINGREIRATEEVHDLVQSESKLNVTVLRNQRVEYFNVYPENIQVK